MRKTGTPRLLHIHVSNADASLHVLYLKARSLKHCIALMTSSSACLVTTLLSWMLLLHSGCCRHCFARGKIASGM
jgi:hypothetical protein